jgi:hypothetical protein
MNKLIYIPLDHLIIQAIVVSYEFKFSFVMHDPIWHVLYALTAY